MKIIFYLKVLIFIYINSIFSFKDVKPYQPNYVFNKENELPKKRAKQSELKSRSENFFNKKKINPLSIFLAFEDGNNTLKEKNKLLIESDEQIENQNSFIAKGNVVIKLNGAKLKTDFIKYSKIENTIISEGNISYQNNNQFLEADSFFYDLNKREGSIKNVYGLIDIVTLAEDLNWESSNIADKQNIPSKITKAKFESNNFIVLSLGQDIIEENSDSKISINNLKKWRFQSPEVLVNDQLLSAERASFTNDPFNPAQLTLESYKLRSERRDGKLILISSWTNLNLDDKVTFPLARRTIKEDQERLQKWGFGFDYEDKDGFYLYRNSDQFKIYDIEYKFINEFYLQRILEDKTKVFRAKDQSITSKAVENKINIGDYFGLKFLTNSSFLGYELNTLTGLNSLNANRLSEALRHKAILSRELNINNFKNINHNIFFIYRNKIDTGFEGIKEIYNALGTNIEKNKNFKINNLDLYSSFRFQIGNFKSEERNGKNLVSKNRISTEAFLENRYNLWKKKNPNSFINESYKYTPLLINQSLDWVTRLTLTSSMYENHESQNMIKLELGPELQLGEQKKKLFDYTNFKASMGFFEKSGKTPFKFDNINESERIYFQLKQQIYGPLMFEAKTHLNLDKNSSEHNKFVNPTYTISFNRRAYNFEIYTIPDRQISGFNFNIFGLGYEGSGKRFKDDF